MNPTITTIDNIPIQDAFSGLRPIQAIPFGHLMCPLCLGHKVWNLPPHPMMPGLQRKTACRLCFAKGSLPWMEVINRHSSFYSLAEQAHIRETFCGSELKPVRVLSREEYAREEKVKMWEAAERFKREKGLAEEA